MGEEVKMSKNETDGDDERVHEWEMGLPSVDDLTPLSTPLIPPELASAFSISPEPYRTLIDVNRASQNTLSSLRGGGGSFTDERNMDPIVMEEAEETEMEMETTDRDGVESQRKLRKLVVEEEADSNWADDVAARTLKRPRLVWTPQLHKRFVDVVGRLGIKNAVPKTIMQLMNVEGLTRENVASHLQKYRLYLKRMHGLSTEAPSSSDQLFASTPVPQTLHENSGGGGSTGGGGAHGSIPMQMMPMVVYGHHMVNQYQHQHHGHEANSYNVMQQKDWSGGRNKYYPHHQVASNDN